MAETPQLASSEVTLNDYLDIVKRRRWVIIQTFAVVAAIGLITTMMATPIYQATAKLKVEAAPLTITTQNSDNPLSSILAQAQPDSVETQIQLLQTDRFIQRVYKQAGVVLSRSGPSPEIKVSNIDRTNIIVVQVESPSARDAKNVADWMLKLHSKESLSSSTKGLENALRFATDETREARNTLDAAEHRLEEFRRRNHVSGVSAEQESQMKALVDAETELSTLR